MPSDSSAPISARKRKTSITDRYDVVLKKYKKSAACRTCHARKVKCSGEKPCTNCVRAGSVEKCEYPERDQNVTVKQSFLETLMDENERLRAVSDTIDAPKQQADGTDSLTENDSTQRNPLLGEGSWFVPLSTSGLPIYISEAADAAFATRFRQALSGKQDIAHIPRTHYVSDGKLATLSQVSCAFPNEARARLLVKVAINNISRRYHFVREDVVLQSLKQYYQHHRISNALIESKLWVLFALGEAYSSRTQMRSEDDFPGLAYFARANRSFLQINERPQSDLIEVLLLLALYSLFINRRHNSYYYANGAVKLCLIMGLHLNIPSSQLPDPVIRTDLKRLWWSAYIFERMLASAMGQPATIGDEDVEVDLLPASANQDSMIVDSLDAEYLNANVLLARLFRDVIATIYSRRRMNDTFSQRVQKALRDLRSWVEHLPKQLQLETAETARPAAKHVRSLHITFNQCVILATRPVLLHIFRANKEKWIRNMPDIRGEVSDTAMALAEACIRCARHSIRLLTESWIDGTLTIFDHFDTHSLFSATTVLAISSISVGRNDNNDQEMFEAGREFLVQLNQNGNFAAGGCCVQLEKIEALMDDFRASVSDVRIHNDHPGSTIPDVQPYSQMPTWPVDMMSTMTAGMALAEPSMQDFLAQADLDLGFLDDHMQYDPLQSLYWPDLSNETSP